MRRLSILLPKISGLSFERAAHNRKPYTLVKVQQEVRNLILLTIGTIIAALGVSLFQVLYNLYLNR